MSKKLNYKELQQRVNNLEKENAHIKKKYAKRSIGLDKNYKKILDLSPDPIAILHTGQYRYVNSTFTNVFGYSNKDLIKEGSFFKLVQEKDKKALAHAYDRRLKGKRTSQFYRIDLIAKDETLIPCETSGRLLNINGESAIFVIIRVIGERLKKEDSLKKLNQRLSIALKGSKSGIWDWNIKTGEVYFSENYFKIAGYELNEFPHSYEEWKKRVHPDDIKNTERKIVSFIKRKLKEFEAEFRFLTKEKEWIWILSQGRIFEYDLNGKPLRFTGTHMDITERKLAENNLKETIVKHEKKVKERTIELTEMNTALKVLLKKREEDKDDIEEKIAANFKLRISPIIDRLKNQSTQEASLSIIKVLELEMKDVLSSFSKKLSTPMTNLTPMEIQVASLIKLGKTNKEISNFLNRSVHTIANHRENMRKKLGIQKKKVNLRSFLLEF